MTIARYFTASLLLTLVACGGAQTACPDPTTPTPPPTATAGVGLVEVESAQNFTDTVSALQDAITSRELRVIAVVPHSAAAAQNELELQPTTLILFGKPQVGAPLMNLAPTLGLDLPQRMLVVETDAGVRLYYNDVAFLAERHGLPADHPAIERVNAVLAAIAGEAASEH